MVEYKIEIEGRKNPIIVNTNEDKEWKRRSYVHQKVIDFTGVHLECRDSYEEGFELEQVAMFKGQRITKAKVTKISEKHSEGNKK